jgi:y4mF family transcriptional regulator
MDWPHVRAAGRLAMPTRSDGRLAAEVRARRTALHLKQEDLADLAGVSERFVYALENGKRTVQLDKVLAVLDALGLHLEIHRGADREIR